MSAANAIATAAAAAAVLSKYNLGSSSGEQEYWESDETWPEVLPAYIDQDVPAESSTGPMAVDVGERVLSSRQEAEKSPTSMDRSAVRRGGVGPYNDSSVQRYPGSDEEDCEEDCEFTFDDDSGDGVYSTWDPFFNTGIQPDDPGYDKEAESIAQESRNQMEDLTRKMKLQRQLAAAIGRVSPASSQDGTLSAARMATDQAVQSAMNAAAMVQVALAESERAAMHKAQLAAVGDTRQYEFNSLTTKLSDYRSQRLSQESFPLPPTHFFILGTLGALTALSFVLLSPPISFTTAASMGSGRKIPVFSSTSRALFALLVASIALVTDFSLDLNVPFGGIVKVKRSVPTAMLLQVRRAILDELPEKERESLVASDELSVRLSAFKRRKYPVAAMLLGKSNN